MPTLNELRKFLFFNNENSLFLTAYERFISERGAFYRERYRHEHCYDTYEANKLNHSVDNPPFVFVLDVKKISKYNTTKNYSLMVNFFEMGYHQFSFRRSDNDNDDDIIESKLSMPVPETRYVSRSLGVHTPTRVAQRDRTYYVPELVYYLLPEDYHYFKDCHPVFRNQSLVRPVRISNLPKL